MYLYFSVANSLMESSKCNECWTCILVNNYVWVAKGCRDPQREGGTWGGAAGLRGWMCPRRSVPIQGPA